jgi:hypothetical protein
MLHDTHCTDAPSSTSVSISTPVWMVMCSEPMMRAPAKRLLARVLRAQRLQARHLLKRQLQLFAAPEAEASGCSLWPCLRRP